jgi:hypothetical protein
MHSDKALSFCSARLKDVYLPFPKWEAVRALCFKRGIWA